jgi:antigen flippase
MSVEASVPAPSVESLPEPVRVQKSGKHSYGQILKSSALIGGSSIIEIGCRIIRTKVMAVLLGPSGVGLMGLYSSIADLAQAVAGMGLNSSGVRQIAAAAGSGENERIARTVAVLRRVAILTGIVGAALLVAFSRTISDVTFGTDRYAIPVALLSVVVFFRLVSGGQGAVIQGMRRISDLARMRVLGGLYGLIISIPIIYFFREDGIVPSLVGVAALTVLTSWWYSRQVEVQVPAMTAAQVKTEAAALLKLGAAFMASGLMVMGAAYAIRLMVRQKIGLDAAGLYQSAWTLGGLYVGFILQAMGSDFYPRLTAVSANNEECNRLVNEQALIGLLLAGPGVIATLTFAPVVIAVFYSAKFGPAADLLRWICLGMTFRVLAWPMGYIVLAKGEQKIFFWTELAATVVHVGLAFFLLGRVGLAGATIAFFGLYVWHGLLIYFIVRRLSGFRWSSANRRTGWLFLPLIGLVFCGVYFLPFWLGTVIGVCASLVSAAYSIRAMLTLVSPDHLPAPLRRVLAGLRLAPSGP